MPELEARILKRYVDVCVGPMFPHEISREITHYVRVYRADMILVTIKPSDIADKQYCAIYVTKKAFVAGAQSEQPPKN